MEKDISKKYTTRCAKWYKTKHLSVLDGNIYTETKPIKDFKEGYERTKAAMKNMGKTDNYKKVSKQSDFEKKVIKETSTLGTKFKSLWGKVTGKKA
jgi:hypothetical protein